jgi:hypothetical protein
VVVDKRERYAKVFPHVRAVMPPHFSQQALYGVILHGQQQQLVGRRFLHVSFHLLPCHFTEYRIATRSICDIPQFN